MAARDRYEINIKCENCKAVGVICISDDDYAHMEKPQRKIDYVKGTFSAHVKDGVEISTVCGSCGHMDILKDSIPPLP